MGEYEKLSPMGVGKSIPGRLSFGAREGVKRPREVHSGSLWWCFGLVCSRGKTLPWNEYFETSW